MTVDINDLSYFGDIEPIIFGLKFHIILHCSKVNVGGVRFSFTQTINLTYFSGV